jgi:hypothetical protein
MAPARIEPRSWRYRETTRCGTAFYSFRARNISIGGRAQPNQVQQGSPTQPGGHSHFSAACDFSFLPSRSSSCDFSADSRNFVGAPVVVFSAEYSSLFVMSVSDLLNFFRAASYSRSAHNETVQRRFRERLVFAPRANALTNFPSISGLTFSTSSPVLPKKSRAWSVL